MANKTMVAPSFLGIGNHESYSKLYVPLSQFFRKIEPFNPDRIHLDFSGLDDFIPENHDERILWLINNFTLKPVEFHLMTHWPFKYLGLLNEKLAHGDNRKYTVIVHPEAADYHPVIFNIIYSFGFLSGIALKPRTCISSIGDNLLGMLDLILIMTVEPGKSGQEMLREHLAKITALAEERARKGYHYLLEVDGGVNDKTAQAAVNAGADILVSGGYIQKDPLRIKWLKSLKRGS